ncbi:late competence development ComFB family protein [Leptothoe kymatousa TAU-MAC 1615]|uniref:Late competence development ComFB family protein n=1 Tax=Leptothoe kymatousa TAU-MAC 1615 TaxID=2364775 RepID=A0ABS5Y1N8_9CYAN|nr:late competence development ComFB family protein [Leptothoe kymatousa TAU-MAC 1615]
MKAPPLRDYINVMELLVAEEVEHQLRQLPTRVLKYVKPIEVETYALNRLPSLYAASEKGWQSQYHKAKHELRKEIRRAVRQALAAVQVDPLRASRPLVRRLPLSNGPNGALLDQFRHALGQPNLTWDSLLRKCKRAGAAKREATEPEQTASSQESDASYAGHSEPSAVGYGAGHDNQQSDDNHGTVWRPGTYGETSWQPKRTYGYHLPQRPTSTPSYDWSESVYR